MSQPCRSGFPFGPSSSGLYDERGPQSHALRGTQVTEVRSHHHRLSVGCEVENIGGGLVDLAIRLVVARELGAEDAVPRQTSLNLARSVINEILPFESGAMMNSLLQPREPSDRVWPGP